MTAGEDAPQRRDLTPDWVILGFRDPQRGYLVMATSDIERADHVKQFDGFDVGPVVGSLPARQPRWKHMLGLMFTRHSVVHGSSFAEALEKLPSVWRPE